MQKIYTAADICANLLGLGTGAARAGFTPIFACDIEEKSKRTFELLKGHKDEIFIHEDIRKLTVDLVQMKLAAIDKALAIGELDLFLAGPPCFGMTGLNRERSVFHYQSMLMLDTLRLISDFQPKTAIIEQVPILLSQGLNPFFNLLKLKLNSMNYKWEVKVLNAAHYGCYQSRNRAIIILVRDDLNIPPSFPEPSKIDLSKQSAFAVIGAEMYRNPKKPGLPVSGKLMFGTMTSQNMEVYKNGRWQTLSIDDRKKLAHMDEIDLMPVLKSEDVYKKMLGNMVLPPFAEALASQVLNEILIKAEQKLYGIAA